MRFPDPASRSAALFERAKAVFPGGSTRGQTFMRPYLLYARSGAGCRITDVDGVERIDFINNFTTQIHGHSHPTIVAAIQAQAALGTGFNMATESEIVLAELILPRARSFEQIRFCNTGSEAVMHAIKAARAATGRALIAKCEGVYHGAYDYAEVSLDSDPQHWGRDDPEPVGFAKGAPDGMRKDVVVLPYNEVEETRRILERYRGKLAGVLLDAAPTRAGGQPISPAFAALLRDFTRLDGALLILDEVVTWRFNVGGAQTLYDLDPDLTTIGKIIGGGLPIGAVAGKRAAMVVFDQTAGKAPVPQSGTFTANPLTMAAGIASVRMLTAESITRLNALGARARAAIQEAFRIAGVRGQVVGEGSLVLIFFAEQAPRNYREAYLALAAGGAEAMDALYRRLLNRGIFLSPIGMACLSTPMGEAEIDQMAEAVLTSLREMKAEGAAGLGL